jgi:hypothetical protein
MKAHVRATCTSAAVSAFTDALVTIAAAHTVRARPASLAI